MGHSVKSLRAFGRRVRQEQDAALESAHSLDEPRARLLAGDTPTATRRWLQRRVWAVAAVLMISLAAVLVLRVTRPAPLTLQARSLAVGEWIRAEEEVPIRFSDGTRVVLRKGAHGLVVNTTAVGARVRLERGEAAVSVVPAPGARWSFEVGPFEVRVTGTRFDTSWDPSREVFRLTMHEGSVVVSGPTIPSTRTLVGGDDLHIDVAAPPAASASPSAQALPSAVPSSATPAVAPDPSAPILPPPPASSAMTASPLTSSALSNHPLPRWKVLLAQGAFKEAYAAAHTEGFAAVIARAEAGDLFQLADAARYAGKPADAKRGYMAVRARFAGTPHAAHAAFALGRMAFPDTVWFARYLKEAPDGPFASEALGRILEAQHALDEPAAQQTAARYLARYPNGPHAALARKLVGQH